MNKKIGEIIREIRNKKGISLRKLAEIVNVSNVNILYIEKGKINTSLPVLKGIAKALNYNLDKLLALADMIDDDIRAIINKRPVLITNFLRAAKKLTNNDWEILTEKILNNELKLNDSKGIIRA
ncbi:helix-turn-helix transcriptional regulator [Candidatus Marinimicrobia bacterium]|nr:helix-turn-helix transcriptional regulator [Candidatus Neomarinimicrobiota bacterium]